MGDRNLEMRVLNSHFPFLTWYFKNISIKRLNFAPINGKWDLNEDSRD